MTGEDAGRIAEKIRETACESQGGRSRGQTGALAGESFRAAREMARRGVPSQTATEAVSQALEKGYGKREMATLRHTFMEESQQEDPRRIAERYCRAIRSGTPSQGLKAAGGYGETARAAAGDKRPYQQGTVKEELLSPSSPGILNKPRNRFCSPEH